MSKRVLTLVLFLAVLLAPTASAAHEISGYIAAQFAGYFNDALFSDQKQNSMSLSCQPEYYHRWDGPYRFTFIPFLRLDTADTERTHFDIRELNLLWVSDLLDIRIGYGKVFWGVTEFYHLVDIINQTDLVESIDAEDKLGQPMLQITCPSTYGLLNLFVMPYFVERTFPGKGGRLRFPLPVDTDRAEYESDDAEHHVDFAVRYSHTIENCDFGIYYFRGTSREPTLKPGFDDNSEPVLYPFYEQINQGGLDIQLVAGQWLLKLESIYQTGREENYFASVCGFEYTLVNLADSGLDLGLIGEWAYDERGDTATTLFQDDLMYGFRLAVNDMASTEILGGLILDMNNGSKVVTIEASRRLGDRWKGTLELWAFMSQPQDDPFYSFRNDDYLRVEMAFYF